MDILGVEIDNLDDTGWTRIMTKAEKSTVMEGHSRLAWKTTIRWSTLPDKMNLGKF